MYEWKVDIAWCSMEDEPMNAHMTQNAEAMQRAIKKEINDRTSCYYYNGPEQPTNPNACSNTKKTQTRWVHIHKLVVDKNCTRTLVVAITKEFMYND